MLMKTPKPGLVTVDEWAKRDHPFEQRFCQDNNIDLSLIFEKGLRFVPSEESVGVQLADVVANTLYRSLRDQDSEYMFLCYSALAPALLPEYRVDRPKTRQLLSFVAFGPYGVEQDLLRRYRQFITMVNIQAARRERGLPALKERRATE